MATDSKHHPFAIGRDTPAKRSRSSSMLVGVVIALAVLVALVGFGWQRTVTAPRDVNSTASAPIATSPPADHPAITEPQRPTPLPSQAPPAPAAPR